jgi:hypothetical protein
MKKSLKNKLEKAGDCTTNLIANAGLTYLALEGIESLDNLDYSTTTQALAAVGAAYGISWANKKGLVSGLSKGVNTFARNIKGKAMPWIRNVILAGSIAGASYLLFDSAKDVYNDFSKEEEEKLIIPEGIVDNEVKVIHPCKTIKGKFERTYRWDEILDNVENKYNLQRGRIKGLAMRESYGDPLRLNERGDGGAGLFMFQPGTADEYGLKVYGYSRRTGIDRQHGEELKRLVKENKNDYTKLSMIDDRFSVYKSSEAAGKFLSKLYKKYGSWDKALSAYNRGTPARNPLATDHVKMTRKFQEYYNKRDKD